MFYQYEFTKYLSSLKEESARRGLDIGCSPSHPFTNHTERKFREDDACSSDLKSENCGPERETLILRIRCSLLEDTVAELRKRIERLEERCFVAPAEIDRNLAENTGDRGLTIHSLEKSEDSSCNTEALPEKHYEKDPGSNDTRSSFSDSTIATDYVFSNILDDDNIFSGISASSQINCQFGRNDIAASSSNDQFDEAHVGQTLNMKQVQVTTKQPNRNDELNVCQHNGKASSSAGCSKRRENGGENWISRSAKKKKEFPSVATMIQTSHSVPKKVKGVLTQDWPPYYCNICDKSFSYQSCWTTHQRIHSEKRPYKCGFCDTRNKYNYNKLQHERSMHTEVARFECAVCGKMFNRKNGLVLHQRVHSGQKPFHCQTCGTSFSRKCYLATHQQTHSKEKTFKCRICNKLFKYHRSKTRHEHSHESPRFECALCGKKYRQKQSLVYHIISHNCC